MRKIVFVSGLILAAVGGILLGVSGLQRNWLVVTIGSLISIYGAFAKDRSREN
jgi:ABC-type amino acid transport system permease subunit